MLRVANSGVASIENVVWNVIIGSQHLSVSMSLLMWHTLCSLPA